MAAQFTSTNLTFAAQVGGMQLTVLATNLFFLLRRFHHRSARGHLWAR